MRKILLIDDDNKILTLLGTWFTAQGYETASAQNGNDAIRLAKKVAPDLIITDLQLAAENGIHVVSDIRRFMPSVKVILLTGVIFEDQETDFTFGGVVDRYLAKPVSFRTISTAVKDLLYPSGKLG